MEQHKSQSETLQGSTTEQTSGPIYPTLRSQKPNRWQRPNLPRENGKVKPEMIQAFKRLGAGLLPWPMYLHGGTGTGKTCGALLFADIVYGSRYMTMEEVLDTEMLSDNNEDNIIDKRQMWRSIKDCELLILDEIGERQKIGDLYATVLKRILDIRETEQGNRSIYISNLSPQALSKLLDDRIMSRLMRGTRFHLEGPDRRIAESAHE
jgi:chromosomal replication initiation ATPase DnaA